MNKKNSIRILPGLNIHTPAVHPVSVQCQYLWTPKSFYMILFFPYYKKKICKLAAKLLGEGWEEDVCLRIDSLFSSVLKPSFIQGLRSVNRLMSQNLERNYDSTMEISIKILFIRSSVVVGLFFYIA